MHPHFHRPLVVLLSVVSLTSLGACRGHHRHDPEKIKKLATWFVDDALDDLEATSEQRQAAQQGKDRLLAAALALRAQGVHTHLALLEEWQKETPDLDRAKALIDEHLARLRTVAHQAVDELAVVHAALTPAQRAVVAKQARERLDLELGVD